MRKFFSLILALSLVLCLAAAHAEQAAPAEEAASAEQYNFLISDWKLVYVYEETPIAEQTIFIYEDKTFEVMDDDESEKGTWTFDGTSLVLTDEDETVTLVWNEEEHQFTGEYDGMTLTMKMAIEPEGETKPAAGE